MKKSKISERVKRLIARLKKLKQLPNTARYQSLQRKRDKLAQSVKIMNQLLADLDLKLSLSVREESLIYDQLLLSGLSGQEIEDLLNPPLD